MTPGTVELPVGGTRPDDVAALRTALGEVLAPWLPGDSTMRSLRDPGVRGVRRALLVPVAPGEDTESLRRRLAGAVVPPGTDVILRTSGTTSGTGRLVAMSGAALVASARATHARLGGPGTWVLALPAHHVAGVQVLVRSLVAGRQPVVVDTSGGFDPGALAGALEQATSGPGAAGAAGVSEAVSEADGGAGAAELDAPGRVYLSLVPTQLHRCLDDPRATAALARVDAVLVGGAALPEALGARARAAGVPVVRTYGMSETGGGCVYDGVPLDGVRVRIEGAGPHGVGRIVISGPVLAQGYVNEAPDDAASPGPRPLFSRGVERELITSDRGRIGRGGLLEVAGRVDDVIISGGIKIDPRQVEAALERVEGVAQACVVGVTDEQWGQAVTAVVVPQEGAELDGEEVRVRARALLDGAHAPKRVVVTDALPLHGIGKVDRAQVARLAGARSRSRSAL